MKVALAFSRLESLMIRTASDFALVAICFFLVTAATTSFAPATASAAPIPQTEDLDKSELEKMILKKIEEKKKENAAKGKTDSTTSKSVPGFNRTSNPPRNRSTSTSNNSRVRPNTSPASNNQEAKGGGIPRVRREGGGEPELADNTNMRGSIKSQVDPDVKIMFNFEDEEWKDVIEFFADQAGFGVYYPTDPPQGTWDYTSTIELSLIESLDLLNSRLSVMQPPHVLVRNGNQLILLNESIPIPEQLIALITPDELDNFGEYEVASCVFALGKLADGNKLAMELREEVSQVHLDGFAYFESTNTIVMRERVRVLRRIYDQIKTVIDDDNMKITAVYLVQHLDAETLLNIIRPLLGIADKAPGFEDGSLNFTIDPLGTTIYLHGTPDRIKEFRDLAEKIDVSPSSEGIPTEMVYFQTHRPPSGSDHEVIFQILQNLLDGEPNVKMDQDANNGNVYIEATKTVHDKVTDFLDNFNTGDSFRVIKLNNLTPSEAKSTIEELLGIDGFDPPEGSPRLVADSDLDRLMVYGTPAQILQIEKIAQEIDGVVDDTTTIRRPLRMIPMSPRRQEDVMNALQIDGIMELKGRKNILNVIMPDERSKPRSGIRYERPRNSFRNDEPGTNESEGQSDTTSVFKPHRQYYVATDNPRQENEETLGRVSEPPFDEVSGQQDPATGIYQPADEIPSVPGAPIEVRMTEQGLVIKSYDLDAADDLEDLINEWFDPEGEYPHPTIIPLEHREVEEAKTILNYFLGLEDSGGGGGGGGGGIGNLLGGAVKNAVGGAAGDALSGFLGGGGDFGGSSTGDGAIELEGEDVRISTDVRFNTLIVTGATGNDIDMILELVEYIDQPGPPQKPKTLGETYQIEIRYRDPMEIKELVQGQLPDYFRQAAQQAGNQQNARQQLEQQVARQLQQAMAGGGRNRRSGNNNAGNNSERPKATLGVDETRRILLVTGPEFIYEEVLALVLKLDQQPMLDRKTKPTGPLSANNLAELLRQTLGDTVEIMTADEVEEQENANSSGAATPSRPGGNTSTAASRAPNRGSSNASQNLTRDIMNRLNAAGRGGGNRGGGGRGGGGRGPGGR